jgi:amino acid adenylation domain-containing protein
MRIDEYITSLRKNNNIIITCQNEELKIKAAQESLSKDLIDDIRARKTEILEFFRAANKKSKPVAIKPAGKKNCYRLSSAQKRLYFLYEFDRTSLAYNLPRIIKLEGLLDREKFNATFKKLLARHESLRTSFEVINGEPVQLIADAPAFEIEYFFSEKENIPSVIKRFIRPFDLGNAPLIRAGLIESAPEVYILMVDMHHIITDGISQGILIRDFMTLYSDEALTPVPLQYKDYAEWQQGEEQQAVIALQKKFWLHEFSVEAPILHLPADFARPLVKTHQGSSAAFEIGVEETITLRRMAEREGATLFMVVLSIYNVLLSKLSNEEDIVLGIPVASRFHADLEHVIGMFVNTLPLRNYPRPELSFKDFLGEVRSGTLAFFDNQSYPYEELIDELKIKRDTGRNPLFDVIFAYQNFDEWDLKIPGLSLKPFHNVHTISKFDLGLEVFESNDKLFLTFEYATALFKQETIERFITYFRKIVVTITEDIHKKISDIEIIPIQEKHQLLYDFNDTGFEYPEEDTVLSLFERQADKTPELVALRYGTTTVSYRELEERMDKTASYLQYFANIGKGDLVGIMLERDEDLIPTIFGIIKAGAAYVPIDPLYPAERINAIIEDARLKVVITRKKYLNESLMIRPGIIALDEVKDEINAWAIKPKDIKLQGCDLAYVIYTSGSTGKPKGVMVAHHSLLNIMQCLKQRYSWGESDIYLFKTSYSFDVSVTEIFGWFMDGGSLSILPQGLEGLPDKLVEAIENDRITHVNFVPSMFSAFVDELTRGNVEKLRSLKYIFLAGEALSKELLEKVNRVELGTALENIYGPTEGTIYSCGYSIRSVIEGSKVPIGKPLHNIKIYILDSRNKLQPVGVPGELCIAGEGLAKGYLNNEELTKEKFIAHPFEPGERLYKTGDVAKWLVDGNIEYWGRIDNQVKIRGFRIELGEIESRLAAYGPIKENVVVAKEKGEDKFLVAYYVSEKPLNLSELRNYLSEMLPDYMIPAFYVHLERLPLSSSGKLDKKSLPDPEFVAGEDYVAPSNSTEEEMAAIWSEVLGISKEKISTTRSFFELGGNSLKILHLNAIMKERLQWEISIPDMFRYPTISSFTGFAENHEGRAEEYKQEIADEVSGMHNLLNVLETN